MKAKIALADPGNVPVTMTITLPLKEWKLLSEQIGGGPAWHSPAGKLRTAITDLTRRAETYFESEGEVESAGFSS